LTMMMTMPTIRQVNITAGTHGGLTFCDFGMGGVYRPDGAVPPFGVTRPPFGATRFLDAMRRA
jgi:hypothetical protein